MNSPLRLTGIGLRSSHHHDFLTKKPPVAWIEIHSENFFADGGKPLDVLDKVRADYPISLHGVALSLGSADELNWRHLKKLRDLKERVEPCLISEHLAFTSIDGRHLHDLLPLPYTEESLNYVCTRIKQVQDYLNQQIIIENITSYLTYTHSTLSEAQFLGELSTQANCGILLDVTNLYINASNLGVDPIAYVKTLPAHRIQEIHLAGFSCDTSLGHTILIDSHDQPIVPAVWDLYRQIIKLIGRKPTIIEWDDALPPLETLCLEAHQAETIMREEYAITHTTV